jgi:signal transduction histidine kinase
VEHVVAGLDLGDAERIAVTAQDLTVEIDGPKVERILDNLVRNALRHAGDDGKVWVRARMIDDELELVVEDTGPGVPRDMRERIFAPFESGSPDRFGLGLALVERLARVQGGRASVAEREGGGARFVVRVGTTPAVVAGPVDPAGPSRVPVDPAVHDRPAAERSDEHGAGVAERREQRR